MFQKLFGPRHTFADAVRVLESGLRSGDIALRDEGGDESPSDIEAIGGHQRVLLELLASRRGHVVIHVAGGGGAGKSQLLLQGLALKDLEARASSLRHMVVVSHSLGSTVAASLVTRGLVERLQEVDPGLSLERRDLSVTPDEADAALVAFDSSMVQVFAEGLALWVGERPEQEILLTNGANRVVRIGSMFDARRLPEMLVGQE